MDRRPRAPARRNTDPLASFLHYVEEIEHAVLSRDAMRITALLRKRTAMHLPRPVREELLAVSRMPRESLRAPVQFLRFQHRMLQLAAVGEGLPTAQLELKLEPPAPAGTIRQGGERRAAARRAMPGSIEPGPENGDEDPTA
jgi:hypothetical protein